MALPKKKSRTITVHDQSFRYVVSRGKPDENWNFDLNVTVQIAHGEGRVLKAEGLVTRDFWLDFPYDVAPDSSYPVLTPQTIAVFIKQGLEAGWNPHQKGSPFVLPLDRSTLKQQI